MKALASVIKSSVEGLSAFHNLSDMINCGIGVVLMENMKGTLQPLTTIAATVRNAFGANIIACPTAASRR
jgi:hypothetical protein